jgi:CIC family chloride channel protein
MVIAVAIAISVRRLLVAENIYTMKLARRGHQIPKDRHANLFMIRHAGDVMNRRLTVLPASLSVAAAREQVPDAIEASYILVAKETHVVGLVRVGPRRISLGAYSEETSLEDIARRDFSLVHRDTVLFNALTRLAKRDTGLVLVVDRAGVPRAEDALGVIDKDIVADSVIEGFRPYLA